MKVSDILLAKGSAVVTIKPSETIGALSQRLRENHIGAAIVSRDGTMVDGVISERDIAYGLAIHKAELHKLLDSLLGASTEIQREIRLQNFYRKVHFVTAAAGMAGPRETSRA